MGLAVTVKVEWAHLRAGETVSCDNYDDLGAVYRQSWHNVTMGVVFFIMSGFGVMLGSARRDPKGIALTGDVREAFIFGRCHVKRTLLLSMDLTLFQSIIGHIVGSSRVYVG